MICRCGKEFEPTRPWQKFCSAKCRYEAFEKDCAAEVVAMRQLKSGKWSVTLRFTKRPRAIGTADIVTVMRGTRISDSANTGEQQPPELSLLSNQAPTACQP